MTHETEFDIFQRMIDSMRIAVSCCRQLAQHRSEHSRAWETVAEKLEQMIQLLYDLGNRKVN